MKKLYNFLIVSALAVFVSCEGEKIYPWNEAWDEYQHEDITPEEPQNPVLPADGKERLVWIDAAANFKDYANSQDKINADMSKIKTTGFTGVIVDVRPTNTGLLFKSDVEGPLTRVDAWAPNYTWVERTADFDYLQAFIDTIIPEDKLPQTLTSYSPCFRKEKGAHGIEERGVYRIHQFEKQEMIVVCKPEDSMMWFDKLWQNTVDLFRSMDIPVRTLECCSGDLADLKVKSFDVEAWSPRQKKYFEVGSCSNLGDAQARRLKIRINGEKGKYFAHTLNNTVVAPPRMLIAFLENNLQADGSVRIPEVLRPYMGGQEYIK